MGFFASSTWAPKDGKAVSLLPKCGACGLFKTCKSPKMAVTGEGKQSILFVGEAPGEEEDKHNEQFVGRAGQQLRAMLEDIDINIDECWKTNSAICRPPHNELDNNVVDYCRPNLLNTIAKLRPKVIVLLGLTAVNSLISTEWGGEIGPMNKWAGWTIPSAKYNAWICPTFHPSYILRTNNDPVLVRMTRDHLRQAAALETIKPPSCNLKALEKQVEIITDLRLAKLRLRELAAKTGIVAWDYETTGLKPERTEHRIVSVSFCLNGEDTFACMVDESLHKSLSRVLQNEKLLKVASNMKFEERWTRRKLGHKVAGWHWDTMLAAHVLDNRSGITSVKFQTYTHLGIGDYSSHIHPYLVADDSNGFNRIHEAPVEDLLKYNGLDALVEYKVMEKQKGLLRWQIR